jgi:aquaporin Z
LTGVQASGAAITNPLGGTEALREHWPEYLSEGAALGIFMVSACVFGVLLRDVPGEFTRRLAGGIAMGLTAVAIICSPFGKRSGAHMNPAVTLAFWSLGRLAGWDAAFYVVAQVLGGVFGVLLSELLVGPALAQISYVATVPGPQGEWIAFGAELGISWLMMSTVLRVSNSRWWSRYTPFVAGCLVATFITFESPLSGMSMNPARTFASAAPSGIWSGFWIYLVAPLLAMLTSAQLYRRRVFCAKLHHHNNQRCIFRCNFGALDNE